MDTVALQMLGGLLSATFQMIATIVILICVINFFSLKPGGSKRFVLVGFLYFFSLMAVLLGGAMVLMNAGSVHTINLVGVLLGTALVHLVYGALLFALYIGSIASRGF